MAILPPGSWPFGYVIEYSSRNFLAASSVSWVLMPRNTTPSSLYFRHASSNTRAPARRTPRGPEVEEDDFPFEVFQTNRRPVEESKRERGRGARDEGRADIPRLSPEAIREQGQHRDGGAEDRSQDSQPPRQ